MGWRVTGWLFGSYIRSRVKAGAVSVSGRVKKRTRQVLSYECAGGGDAAAGERKRVSRKRWDGGATKEWKGTALWMPGYMLRLKATSGGEKGGGKDRAGQSVPPHSYIHNASRRVPRPSFLASCTVGRAAAVEDGRCR